MGCLCFIVRKVGDSLETSLARVDGLQTFVSCASEDLSVFLSSMGGLTTSVSAGRQQLVARYSVTCGTYADRKGEILSASDGDLYDGNNELIYAAE